MARPGFRTSDKQVQAWVPLALHIRMKKQAEAESLTLQDWMLEAFREKTGRRDDDGTSTRPVVGRAPVTDFSRSGPVENGSSENPVGVVASDGSNPLVTDAAAYPVPKPVDLDFAPEKRPPAVVDWGAIMADGASAKMRDTQKQSVTVMETIADPWEMEGAPANRDSRGRILAPIVRDELIDLP